MFIFIRKFCHLTCFACIDLGTGCWCKDVNLGDTCAVAEVVFCAISAIAVAFLLSIACPDFLCVIDL